jgi:hypothetical protein
MKCPNLVSPISLLYYSNPRANIPCVNLLISLTCTRPTWNRLKSCTRPRARQATPNHARLLSCPQSVPAAAARRSCFAFVAASRFCSRPALQEENEYQNLPPHCSRRRRWWGWSSTSFSRRGSHSSSGPSWTGPAPWIARPSLPRIARPSLPLRSLPRTPRGPSLPRTPLLGSSCRFGDEQPAAFIQFIVSTLHC